MHIDGMLQFIHVLLVCSLLWYVVYIHTNGVLRHTNGMLYPEFTLIVF